MSARILATAMTTAVLAACGTDDGTAYGGPDQVVDTIGDTIVARTLSGSVWGVDATLVPEVSIGELEGPEEYLFGNVYAIAVDDNRHVYVLDSQAENVRVFDADGIHLRTLGGRGEGPGELQGAGVGRRLVGRPRPRAGGGGVSHRGLRARWPPPRAMGVQLRRHHLSAETDGGRPERPHPRDGGGEFAESVLLRAGCAAGPRRLPPGNPRPSRRRLRAPVRHRAVRASHRGARNGPRSPCP